MANKIKYSKDTINLIEKLITERLAPMIPDVKSGKLPSEAAVEGALFEAMEDLADAASLVKHLLDYHSAQSHRKGMTLKFRHIIPLRLRKFHDSLWDKLDLENPTIATLDLTHATIKPR